MGTARVQGQRDVALNELAFRGIAINDATNNTAAVTVYASDSGILFVNKYITDHVTYTLPAVADGAGKIWWFFNANTTKNILVTAPSACMYHSGAAVTTMTSPNAVGGCAFVIGDGTLYYFFEIEGVWT